MLSQFQERRAHLAIFIAPTRALVTEIERSLVELLPSHGLPDVRVGSLPLMALGDQKQPTILVFTQERLHVFLNALPQPAAIDIMIVDEAQKVGEGLRGVILQDAIERILAVNPNTKTVFLSPLTRNPEVLLTDAPEKVSTAISPSNIPTVTQNLIFAQQRPRFPHLWDLLLSQQEASPLLGTLVLHASPDTQIKRLSYVAIALGKNTSGTLVYANGAAEAEKISWQIYDAMPPVADQSLDQDLLDLSHFIRDTIHRDYQLVSLVKRGVAFHYGNMPALLRAELEHLFRIGKLKFLVCTSTLIEGVNLACRTIVVRGPRKGNGHPMQGQDFWNLAGRAGRWGQDFYGNIVCVDYNKANVWPGGPPRKTQHTIQRRTDAVLEQQPVILSYLRRRWEKTTNQLEPELEQVMAYLICLRIRSGTLQQARSMTALSPDYIDQLETATAGLQERIDLPHHIILRHPGVSAVALQNLLNYFRTRGDQVEDLIPASPASDDAYPRLSDVFTLINDHVAQVFLPSGAIPVYVLVTLEWMRGLPLGAIINQRIRYNERHGRPYDLPKLIRDTMRDVEESARFRAPKYLSAYMDVLKYHLERIDKKDMLSEDLNFDLYLEFGVATQTLLSLLSIGLSRTSALAVNDFLSDDKLTEAEVLARLQSRQWSVLDIPRVIKNEIESVLTRKGHVAE